MNQAIATHTLKPVIDETFAFEDARSAYHGCGKHRISASW